VSKTWKNRRDMKRGGRVRDRTGVSSNQTQSNRRESFHQPLREKHPRYFWEEDDFCIDVHGFAVFDLELLFPALEAKANEQQLFDFVIIHGYRSGRRLAVAVREHYGEENVEFVKGNPGATRVFWKGKV
jgi:hypothetical protein